MLERLLDRLPRFRSGPVILLLAAAAFVHRLGVSLRFIATPYHEFTLHVMGPDQNRFLLWAEQIRLGRWQVPGTPGDAPFEFSPAYSWLLSLSLGYARYPFLLMLALQALLSAAAGWAIWDTLRRLGAGAAAAFAGALLWFCYAPSAYYDGCLIRESLLASTGILAFRAAIAAWDRPSAAGGVRAGLWAGICMVLRPHLLAPAILGVFLAAAAARRDRRRLICAAALTLSFAAVLAPTTVRNLVVSGRWVPVSTQGADALILGNDVEGPGIGFVPTANSKRLLSDSGGSAFSAAGAVARDFWERPRLAAELYARKLRMLVNDYEVPDNYSFYVWRFLLPPARVYPITWSWLFALACVGAWIAWRRGGRWRLALGAAGILLAGAAMIHIQSRYRFVAVPFLAILAGAAIGALLRSLRDRRWARVFAVTAAITLIVAGTRPLPSLGYYHVTGADGVRRLNQDVIRGPDYLTLLSAWTLSGGNQQSEISRRVARMAYQTYGASIVMEFERVIGSLTAGDTSPLSAAYRTKYGIDRS